MSELEFEGRPQASNPLKYYAFIDLRITSSLKK